jgi:hypothetical protein
VSESELAASLREIHLIQTLRPRENLDAAFPFLYPFIGIRVDGAETGFCLTTSPEAFPSFDLHGAFRSRRVTKDAFFALMRLLRFVGHPRPRSRRHRLETPPHSHIHGFRRLPDGWPQHWARFLRGESRDALEALSLRLLDHDGARARRALVAEDLRAVARFFREEAMVLAAAIRTCGCRTYPVSQRARDALLVEYRDRARRAAPPARPASPTGAVRGPA